MSRVYLHCTDGHDLVINREGTEAEEADFLWCAIQVAELRRALADEVARRIRGMRVLFTTGYVRNAIVHVGRLDPGVSLLGKPFSYSELA